MASLRAKYLVVFVAHLNIKPAEIDEMRITDFVRLTRFMDQWIEAQKP